jgi:SAM-dependent methyltransferase
MNQEEYQLVSEVQTSHWWWIGRRKILEILIENHFDLTLKLRIADVGAGFGANISMLRQYGDVTALELNKAAIMQMGKKWGQSIRTIIWKSPEKIEGYFDLILLADVLEHIPDDREAVTWIWEHLAPGGCVVITAPAHLYLWSDMDDVVCHYRRYSVQEIRSLFHAPFETVYLSYYNFFLFPVKLLFVGVIRLRRLMFNNAPKRSFNDKPLHIVNSLFTYVLYLEAKLMKYATLPYGVSLVCIMRKPLNAAK